MKALMTVLTILIVLACGKKDDAPLPNPGTSTGRGDTGTTTGSTTGSTGTTTGSTGTVPVSDRYNWPEGATVDIEIDKSTLESFMQRTVNVSGSVVPAKLNVAMTSQGIVNGNQVYRGRAPYKSGSLSVDAVAFRLAFEELQSSGTGTRYTELKFFTSYLNNSYGTPLYKNRFNRMYVSQLEGVQHFKAFAQDRYGSILFVADGIDDNGLFSGRLYFHNFDQVVATQGPELWESCWMIQAGPYECRDYLDPTTGSEQNDQVMRPELRVNPYRQRVNLRGQNLGQMFFQLTTFQALNGQKALNN